MGNQMVGFQIGVIIICLLIEFLSGLETTSFGCTCGKDPNNKDQNVYKIKKAKRKSTRIVGGEEVKNPNPWFVFIQFKSQSSSRIFRCGGTLLNQKWVLTAAHCFCDGQNEKKKCKKKKGRLVPDYDLQIATLHFGINVAQVGRVDKSKYRGIKKVIIHKDYDEKETNSYNDLALLKFDRPLLQKDWNWDTKSNDAIYPICLPENSYNEVGKISYVTGFGQELQDTCFTNGKGPAVYTTCAPGSTLNNKGKMEKHTHYTEDNIWVPGCANGKSPARLDPPCYGFSYSDYKNKFKDVDEIVLVPKNRSIKPLACYDSNADKTDPNRAESSRGWCGTCVQDAKKNTPGYCGPGAGASEANFAKVTSTSGWGYCGDDCRVHSQWSKSKLSIVHQTILSKNECQKLLKGIKSNKTLDGNKQLCAGNKIELKTPLFYEYEGKIKTLKFKNIKPIKKFRSPRENFVPGLNFMIGGKDSCKGDSGGPLWTREGKVRGKELAYLVGVVSAGAGVTDCANLNSPAFYTKIKKYLSWIKKHASDGKCGSSTQSQSKNKKKKKKSSKKVKKKKSKPSKKKKKKKKRKKAKK